MDPITSGQVYAQGGFEAALNAYSRGTTIRESILNAQNALKRMFPGISNPTVASVVDYIESRTGYLQPGEPRYQQPSVKTRAEDRYAKQIGVPIIPTAPTETIQYDQPIVITDKGGKEREFIQTIIIPVPTDATDEEVKDLISDALDEIFQSTSEWDYDAEIAGDTIGRIVARFPSR